MKLKPARQPAGFLCQQISLVTGGASMQSINSFYHHTDHQGLVRAIADQTGTITNAYVYAEARVCLKSQAEK